jgi:multisubunit Na+/H+ antiporter MnhG subunit
METKYIFIFILVFLIGPLSVMAIDQTSERNAVVELVKSGKSIEEANCAVRRQMCKCK